MRQYSIIAILLTSILLTLAGCDKKSHVYENADAIVDEIKDDLNMVSPEQLKSIIDTAEFFVLIDVREPEEHFPGYIGGSVNIPRGILEFTIDYDQFWESRELEAPSKSDLIIVYSKKGKRSLLAASTLEQLGFTNVYYLENGYKNWELTYPNDFERSEASNGLINAPE